MAYQIKILGNLSENRYISGMAALNLPAPEGTSGDWHFLNVFFRDEKTSKVATVAGDGEEINTNHIFKNYGIYQCDEALNKRGLKAEGEISYSANHFRAILDLLYWRLKNGKDAGYMYGAAEDYLDTEEEKKFLLEKAAMMLPYLFADEQTMLLKWINKEHEPGYRSRGL